MTESAKGDGGWVSRLIEAGQPAPDSQLDQVSAESARLQLPGPGWSPILEEMHRALAEIDPDYALLQVKEKFGVLRIHAAFSPETTERCHAVIRSAEARTSSVCECCGASGRLRDQRRRKLTLCDECDAREPEGRPAPNAWRD